MDGVDCPLCPIKSLNLLHEVIDRLYEFLCSSVTLSHTEDDELHPLAFHENKLVTALVQCEPSLSCVNWSCRSLPGLALAGDLQLHPSDADDGLYVLHAGDASLPAVAGQEAGGRGGASLPARTGRPRRMGVCSYRGRL